MLRVTPSQSLQRTLALIGHQGAAIGKLQTDLSSGIRLQRPSDDPLGQQTVLLQRARQSQLEAQTTAIQTARSQLEQANTQTLAVHDVIVRARVMALEGRQADAPERTRLANDVDRLLGELASLANSAHEGTPLFAGADHASPPFAAGANGSDIRYQGSELPGVTTLSNGVQVQVRYPGSDLFQPQGRGATLVIGRSGAAPGSGTSSARGDRTLQVRHTATTYAPGSGVQPGASSAGGDTILGPNGAHTLTIVDASGVGAFGTVALNGGPPVPFTSADTNLAVAGPYGELVHVDTTAITPGFNGTAAISAAGTLSIDGGLSTVPLDFSADQTLVDSRDGSVVYLDTSGVRRVADDDVEFTATADIFQALRQFRDDLRNGAGLDNAGVSAAIGRRLDDLERLSDHLLAAVGDQATSLQQLDRLQTRAEDLQLEVTRALSAAEDTDYAAAALELQQQQTQLQFSLASIVRLLDVSVLNYLS